MTITSPRFGATFTIDPSVSRDWSAGIVTQLQRFDKVVEVLPDTIESVRFWSYSGEGVPSRSLAYNDLWMAVKHKDQKEEQSIPITDGLKLVGTPLAAQPKAIWQIVSDTLLNLAFPNAGTEPPSSHHH